MTWNFLNVFHEYMSCTCIITAYCIIREGSRNPLQYSCLENPVDGEWQVAGREATKGWTQLSD